MPTVEHPSLTIASWALILLDSWSLDTLLVMLSPRQLSSIQPHSALVTRTTSGPRPCAV